MATDILELRMLKKEYYGVPALKGINLSVKKGEVLGLIGENGAGKSTLIKIIAGAIQKTSGDYLFDGKKIEPKEPKDAIDLGIGVVYQEFNLFQNLSVYENIFFGVEYRNVYGILDRKRMINEAKAIIKRLGFDFDVTVLVKELSTSFQQIVEIAKCINRNVKVLIMDEPSASLTENEVEKMFQVIRDLNASGVTIIYISHKLNEVLEVTDRITILRDGEYIATVNTKEVEERDLIRYMVGRSMQDIYPVKEHASSEIALSCKNITGGIVDDVSFDLYRGEVLGFGGLVGAGRTELMRLVFGADRMVSGSIAVNGQTVKIHTPSDAIRHGIALVPEDRKHQGLILNKSVFVNAILPSLKTYANGPIVEFGDARNVVAESTSQLNLKANNLEQLVIHLSGGNQQKVVLSKWLIKNSNILIFDEPTRGIDIGAKQEIYTLIKDLARTGKSIIVISSEMPELIGLSHRILVMKDGKISGEVFTSDMSQETIMKLAS